MKKWSSVVYLLCLASLPGEWCHTGAQCLSLLLAGPTFTSSCGQVILGEWKSMLSIPCKTSISATPATLFMGPLGNDSDGQQQDGPTHSF